MERSVIQVNRKGFRPPAFRPPGLADPARRSARRRCRFNHLARLVRRFPFLFPCKRGVYIVPGQQQPGALTTTHWRLVQDGSSAPSPFPRAKRARRSSTSRSRTRLGLEIGGARIGQRDGGEIVKPSTVALDDIVGYATINSSQPSPPGSACVGTSAHCATPFATYEPRGA